MGGVLAEWVGGPAVHSPDPAYPGAHSRADNGDGDRRHGWLRNAKEVRFGWEGARWTIDLSAKNRARLEKALKPYMAKAMAKETKQSARGVRSVTGSRCCSAGGLPGEGADGLATNLQVRHVERENGRRLRVQVAGHGHRPVLTQLGQDVAARRSRVHGTLR